MSAFQSTECDACRRPLRTDEAFGRFHLRCIDRLLTRIKGQS